MTKSGGRHMPGNRDTMPHVRTDGETRDMCLDTRQCD